MTRKKQANDDSIPMDEEFVLHPEMEEILNNHSESVSKEIQEIETMREATKSDNHSELLKTLNDKESIFDALLTGKIDKDEALNRFNYLSRLEGKKNSLRSRIREYLEEDCTNYFAFLSQYCGALSFWFDIPEDTFFSCIRPELERDPNLAFNTFLSALLFISKNRSKMKEQLIDVLGEI